MLQEEVELRKMLPEVFYDSNGFCTDRFRNSGRFCKKIALQEINIQFQYLQKFSWSFQTLGNDFHASLMCIGNNIFYDLLLVRIGVDIAVVGKIQLDLRRRKLQKRFFIAVAAAVVIQGKYTGKSRHLTFFQQSCKIL